jgi:hypothetical protein
MEPQSTMNHTLTFYSISPAQVDGLKTKLKDSTVTEPEKGTDGKAWGGHISGDTPLGKVEADYSYNLASRQLMVTITDKPFVLNMGTIESHLRTNLAQIGAEVDAAPVEPAEPALAAAAPRGKKAKVEAAESES